MRPANGPNFQMPNRQFVRPSAAPSSICRPRPKSCREHTVLFAMVVNFAAARQAICLYRHRRYRRPMGAGRYRQMENVAAGQIGIAATLIGFRAKARQYHQSTSGFVIHQSAYRWSPTRCSPSMAVTKRCSSSTGAASAPRVRLRVTI